jgi:hypothetical protein
MVCGEGLHGLFGLHHSSCSAHSHDFYSCGHSGHESPETGDHLAIHTTDHDCGQVNEADCPICSFFAFAHCLPVLSLTLCEPLIVAESVVVTRYLDVGDKVLVYQSRAPPVLAC